MKNRFRTVFWPIAVLVVGGLIVWAMAPRPIPADFSRVTRGDLLVTVQDEGYTRVRDTYTVSAPVGGRLLRIEAEAGDAVKAGETLARILASDPAFLDARSRAEAEAVLRSADALLSFARSEVSRAEAEVEFARKEMDRNEILSERGTVSQASVDRARLQLRNAEAALATARATVRARQAEAEAAKARLVDPGHGDEAPGVVNVTSPIRGAVLRVLQESETVLAPGQPIVEVGDPTDLEIVAELLSTDAVRVVEGAPARIEDWGGSRPLDAVVRRVEPFGFLKVSALGVEEQRVRVILDLIDQPEQFRRLGHGYRVEPEIVLWHGEDVVTAPVAALFRDAQGWAAYVVEDGRAVRRHVTLGRSNGVVAQITAGLEPGETIVLYPSERISDGKRVSAR